MNKHTILVVEDDPEIRETVADILEDRGYRTLVAANGQEALRCLEGCEDLPCLILLDLMMPVMDGVGFRMAQLRQPGLAGIPVVVVSAFRDLEDTVRVLQVRDFLEKPFEVDALMGAARRYCPGGEAECRR